MTYSWEGAVRRVNVLRREYGIWPGIVACVGGWRLTFDPPLMLGKYEQGA